MPKPVNVNATRTQCSRSHLVRRWTTSSAESAALAPASRNVKSLLLTGRRKTACIMRVSVSNEASYSLCRRGMTRTMTHSERDNRRSEQRGRNIRTGVGRHKLAVGKKAGCCQKCEHGHTQAAMKRRVPESNTALDAPSNHGVIREE